MSYYVLLPGDKWAETYQQLSNDGERIMRAERERLYATHDLSIILTAVRSEMHLYLPDYDDNAPDEYKNAGVVIFLNEGAMQMFRKAGLEVHYYAMITDKQLPQQTQATVSYYLP